MTTTARKMLVYRHPTPKLGQPRREGSENLLGGYPETAVVRQNVAVAIPKKNGEECAHLGS